MNSIPWWNFRKNLWTNLILEFTVLWKSKTVPIFLQTNKHCRSCNTRISVFCSLFVCNFLSFLGIVEGGHSLWSAFRKTRNWVALISSYLVPPFPFQSRFRSVVENLCSEQPQVRVDQPGWFEMYTKPCNFHLCLLYKSQEFTIVWCNSFAKTRRYDFFSWCNEMSMSLRSTPPINLLYHFMIDRISIFFFVLLFLCHLSTSPNGCMPTKLEQTKTGLLSNHCATNNLELLSRTYS